MSSLRPDDPRQLGDYRLTERLGQGGQGVVFLGHTPQGAQVAVKLLHASMSADPEVRRRFMGEVEAVRRVAPFCTAQVLDASLDGDRPYLVSEYVDGVSLREHVIAKGPRSGGSLDRLAIGTATALGAIHRAGVVHRDFKPGNVLLSLDGPRVIDFGVSRLMDTTASTNKVPIGTPAYLAPERIKGEPAGPPADLFAWALTVAFTATGRHAYTADTYQEVLARILYGKPDLGRLGGPLRQIVDACLAPDPGDRPDAEQVLRLLLDSPAGDVLSSGARAAHGDPNPGTTEAATVPDESGQDTTAPDAALPGAGRKRRIRPWQLGVAAIGLAMAVSGFVLWLRGAQSPGLTGTWTGSAEHPTAHRVFPVEIRMAQDGDSAMRWGADLHCQGRLRRTGSALVFTLDQVTGDQCYPGTVRVLPAADAHQAVIKVTRQGEKDVTYSGTVSRPS
ncbi:serine/threonine-protein kinase [Nonomuraea sediminis]|uniref:serine/threonine-protein kinase n=1 Tax=Nonomuraea sediminis TaxID=2835864 RepID=UPI001BDCA4E4|nr:serine/threonine-protein kinase [Nonomuraea sediminis]